MSCAVAGPPPEKTPSWSCPPWSDCQGWILASTPSCPSPTVSLLGHFLSGGQDVGLVLQVCETHRIISVVSEQSRIPLSHRRVSVCDQRQVATLEKDESLALKILLKFWMERPTSMSKSISWDTFDFAYLVNLFLTRKKGSR